MQWLAGLMQPACQVFQSPAVQGAPSCWLLTISSLFQGCNGAHDEDPADGASVKKQVTDFILL